MLEVRYLEEFQKMATVNRRISKGDPEIKNLVKEILKILIISIPLMNFIILLKMINILHLRMFLFLMNLKISFFREV